MKGTSSIIALLHKQLLAQAPRKRGERRGARDNEKSPAQGSRKVSERTGASSSITSYKDAAEHNVGCAQLCMARHSEAQPGTAKRSQALPLISALSIAAPCGDATTYQTAPSHQDAFVCAMNE